MATYFLPTDSINIPSFYGRACVVPKKYLNTDLRDIQDHYPSFLLLSTKPNVKESDCSMEVTLSDNEIGQLIPLEENFYLSKFPIPLSRIINIYFKSNNDRERVVATINASTAYINASITKTLDDFQNQLIFENTKIEVQENTDLLKQIDLFDRLLGGFSLMKTSGEPYMNYSQNYFATLSVFNTLIKDDTEKEGLDHKTKLQDAFFGNSGFKDLYPYLYKKIEEEDVKRLAKQENQQLTKNKLTGIIDISSLEKMTYVLSVLYSYGVGEEPKKNKIDSLIINNFQNIIKPEFSEIIALCYGINRGYRVFTRDYKINDKNVAVKFKLNRKLDYYTIESLFQFAFFDNLKNDAFTYIDKYLSFNLTGDLVRKKNTAKILDETVFFKKKPKVGTKEYLQNFSQIFFQKTIEGILQPFLETIISVVSTDINNEYDDILQENKISLRDLDFRNENLISEKNKLELIINEQNQEISTLRSKIEELGSNSGKYSDNENLINKDLDIIDQLRKLKIENEKFIYYMNKISIKGKANSGITKIIEEWKNDNTFL